MDKSLASAPNYYLVIDLEATTSDDGSLPPEQMEDDRDRCRARGRPDPRARRRVPVVRAPGSPTEAPPVRDEADGHHAGDGRRRAAVPGSVRGAACAPHRPPAPARVGVVGALRPHSQFERDCGLHGIANTMPAHVNLKTMFSEKQGLKKKQGMAGALKLCQACCSTASTITAASTMPGTSRACCAVDCRRQGPRTGPSPKTTPRPSHDVHRLAVVSDVPRGRPRAGGRALRVIDAMGCDAIVCAGDTVDYGLFSE